MARWRRSPYDGRSYVADASAWTRAHHASVLDDWSSALRNDQIATCALVMFELLYSARDGEEYDRLAEDLGQLHDVPISRSVASAALGAMRALAHVRPFYHRGIKLPDLLIAAAAQDVGMGVLHYDAHYDRLAEVLEFESRWIAPPGTLD